ncbi:glycine cleavage system protein GcvH [Kitasatospora herbaricolor]|uniref:Glycine cleavage system H protein n=1 Tax=Kitasatospora herbaricolor TaxID=68217 RepID=A0ABZ1WAV7_9ACTN|nr:glycine cleavage system protein GcvH [Kitasatospora herbaricolor]
MADIPTDLKYSKDHEWVRPSGNGKVRIGITDHAQRQLGDIVYVEQPKSGDSFESSEPFGSVESVKAVSEIYMPVGGTIAAVNEDLNSDPEYLNTDPYGEGWIVQVTMSDPKHLDDLLTAAEYADYIREEAAD